MFYIYLYQQMAVKRLHVSRFFHAVAWSIVNEQISVISRKLITTTTGAVLS